VPEHVRPAHPGAGLTADGRRMQVVTTYTRRGSRLTRAQESAWERRSGEWLVPDTAATEGLLDQERWFGRVAPLIVEIGSGTGESVAAMAAARPSYDVLAFEVWKPGVAQTFLHLEQTGATNVRLMSVDAVWCLEHLFVPGQLAGLWTFFPDPWHKKRHHKRRLVTAGNAAVAATRMAPGAEWRLATDWADYAGQIGEVLDAEPALGGGVTPRWEERPLTKFERRGLREGRSVTDFCYTRLG
jgi:tRNA (guanine-N7-)-methyltransferase